MENSLALKFYHPDRFPIVHFMTGGELCHGFLTSFRRNGVQIRVDSSVGIEPGAILTAVQIEKYGRSFSGPDLIAADIIHHPRYWEATADTQSDSDSEHLARSLTDLESPPASPAAGIDPTTIPRVHRQLHYQQEAVSARLDWAGQVSGADLKYLAKNIFKPEALAGNIENYIGAVQIPVGLVGPILINGLYCRGYVPVPVATTEGALISSMTRGSLTCNQSGGITVHVQRQTMVRAPVFFVDDMDAGIALEQWVNAHEPEIRAKAESVSAVARLTRIVPFVFENTVHIRFYYTTGDAAGQNMTTACTWMACRWIKRKVKQNRAIGPLEFIVEGNMSGDKKVTAQSIVDGRGIAVTATCRIPGHVMKKRLRVTPERFVRCWQAAEAGAAQSGMPAANINFANAVAGIFTATGQDIACVHESAVGYFKARCHGDDIVCSAHLPSLIIGTIGGGTRLPTQKEALSILGCEGQGKVFRLAEIIAAACLALDISTGSAITANEFVRAHEQLGRNRPGKRLAWSDIDSSFFNTLFDDTDVTVNKASRYDLDTAGAVVSDVVRKNSREITGLFGYRLTLVNGPEGNPIDTVLKIKPGDRELINIGAQVARLTGEDTLSGLYEAQSQIFNIDNSNVREIAFYREADPRYRRFIPRIHGTRIDRSRRIYAILMENLSHCSHLNTVDTPEVWTTGQVESVLASLAAMHSVYWNRYADVPESMQIKALNTTDALRAEDLLRELTRFNASRYPELISPELRGVLDKTLSGLPEFIGELAGHPMTLTHNDFNPRNICLRPTSDGLSPVVYDWELSFFQNPQHDLIEFLIFILDPSEQVDAVRHFSEFYTKHLKTHTGDDFSNNGFDRVLWLNAVHLALFRFNLYLLGHNILKFTFIERVYRNLSNFILSWGQG